MAYTVIIVDDEENGRTVLKLLIEKHFKELRLLATCRNINEAEVVIRLQKPDIVLLDVQMPGGNGFDLLKKLPEINFALVFTTAHEQYALKALRLSAVDYLLKPVSRTDLAQALEKSIKFLNMSSLYKENIEAVLANTSKHTNQRRLVINKYTGEYVLIDDIVCVKAESNYSIICTLRKKYVVSKTLKEIEDLITGEQQPFLRISRAFLANLNYASHIIDSKEGLSLVLRANEVLEISRRRWPFLKQIFSEKKIAMRKA